MPNLRNSCSIQQIDPGRAVIEKYKTEIEKNPREKNLNHSACYVFGVKKEKLK